MQTATSETESKSLDLSICVHHCTLRAPCPKGQGITGGNSQPIVRSCLGEQPTRLHFYAMSSALPPFSLQPSFFGG